MSDEQTTYGKLAARFTSAEHKTKTIGGTDLTYVDGETVISRLNDALGFDGWAFEVKDVKVLEDEVWAMGRLTVYSGERAIVREQAGGQIINRKRGIPAQPARPAQEADGDRPAIPAVPAQPAVKGEIVELNNDIKGAITDCLKKCATLVGVGLYLYDPAARTEVKAEMQAAKRGGNRPAPAPTPIRTTPEVEAAAQLTGAPAPPQPAGYFCVECHGLIKTDGEVSVPKKKKDGSIVNVMVPVTDYVPVCEERLGAFYCPPCYGKKYLGAA